VTSQRGFRGIDPGDGRGCRPRSQTRIKKPAPTLAAPAQSAPKTVATAAPAAASFAGTADLDCDLLVLGAGPGGYSAAFRAADLGLKVIVVERYASLGGVCLNVGCIPSKALLHVAFRHGRSQALADLGVSFGAPSVDRAKLLGHKDKVVHKLTQAWRPWPGCAKVTVVRRLRRLCRRQPCAGGRNHRHRPGQDRQTQVIAFKNCIIAAGSQAVRLPFMPDDERVVDSTGALALGHNPKRMLILGGGIIGLEMGTVYSSLGARLTWWR